MGISTTMTNIAKISAGVVLGAGLTATAVSASIPDSSGQIHGCYQTASPHSLRVIDTTVKPHCPAGTISVTWSKTGPRGAPGVTGNTGAPGAKGDAGAQGPSDAWSSSGTASHPTCFICFNTDYVLVTSTTLPAGAYVVNATVTFKVGTANSNGGPSAIACNLGYPTTGGYPNDTVDLVDFEKSPVLSVGQVDSIPLTTTFTLLESTQVGVYCWGDTFSLNSVTDDGSITATAVANLH
jgi:hypothetical protein